MSPMLNRIKTKTITYYNMIFSIIFANLVLILLNYVFYIMHDVTLINYILNRI